MKGEKQKEKERKWVVVINMHGDGMKKIVFFCLMIIIHYLISARINRFRMVFALSSSSSSSPLEDPSPSFFGAAVVVTILAFVVFFDPRRRRFVVCFSPLCIAIEPPATFGTPSFTDGATLPAGRAGVTALTFEAIHAK
jgi:hypothetical protein